jgi:hypothetical protein
MPTSTRTSGDIRRREKPERSHVLEDREGTLVLTITLQQGRQEHTVAYFLSEIPADWGRGFELRKSVPDASESEESVYHVNVDGQHSTCDCRGYERWRFCKHLATLLELVEERRL